MLFGFFGSLLNSTVAYAYPAYASFKSLSRRPASEPELERWLMYWSVVGSIIAVEYVAEWSVRWIPLYGFMKTIFLLWLALPQTQGATYIYQNHLSPFLTKHEPTIDSHLSQYKTRLYAFLQNQLRVLWTHVTSIIAQHTGINLNALEGSASPDQAAGRGAAQANAQGQLNQGAQVVLGLWRTWGPSITNALRPPITQQPQVPTEEVEGYRIPLQPRATQPRAQRPMRTPAPSAPVLPTAAPSTSSSNLTDTQSIRARKRAIEAELARLNALEQQQGGVASTSAISPHLPNVPSSGNLGKSVYLPAPGGRGDETASDSASASEASLGTEARTVVRDSGRYEEINREDLDEDGLSDGSGHARPPAQSRWSFWSRGSYAPVDKDE